MYSKYADIKDKVSVKMITATGRDVFGEFACPYACNIAGIVIAAK